MQIRTAPGTYENRSANPLQPYGSTAPPPPGGSSIAGVQINEQTALQIAAVYGAVSLISDSIATLPVKQWRMMAGEAREMDPAPVIQRPWSELDQRDFITQGTMSWLLRGNLWGRIVSRDPVTVLPTQVQLVHPDHARVRRLPQTSDGMPAGALEFRYWGQRVPTEDVTRKMALSLPEGIEGLSPISYMRAIMGVAHAQDIHTAAFLSNSAQPGGVIETPEELDEDEIQDLKAAWNVGHQGPRLAGAAGVLTGGATWKPISMTFQDAQFLEMMQLSESVISGRIYRVPPHMLGMVDRSTSWGNGIEQQELGFVRNTLLIWLSRWEDIMSSWLPARQFVTFDLSQRLRGDTLQRFSAYQMGRVMGAMNNLEIRQAEGMSIPTDPVQLAALQDFSAPLNSAPVKALSSSGVGPGGDKAD